MNTPSPRSPEHFLPIDRRVALSGGAPVPHRADGAVLFADISGFSQLTGLLTEALGLHGGAEELSRNLDHICGALIERVHETRGSVIAFAGDAITCWFADADDASGTERALACAVAMQRTIAGIGHVVVPPAHEVPVSVKVAISAGPVRRFLVGDPEHQVIEVLAGDVLEAIEAVEGTAERGDIVVSQAVLDRVPGLPVTAKRTTKLGTTAFVVDPVYPGVATTGWDDPPHVPDDVARGWVLPPVLERLRSGQHDFVAELRASVPMFLRFEGLDYEHDPDAGDTLDRYVRWVQGVLDRFEGMLLQLTTGDKGSYLFFVFGALKAHEDDVVRALACAEALHDPPADLGFAPNARIGISRGRLFAGAYGGARRLTFAVLGNETNIAARLMSKADAGETLVSPLIKDSAGEGMAFDDRGVVALKGIVEPMQLWAPRRGGRHDRRSSARVAETAMVGRTAELASLGAQLEALVAGRSATIVVAGDAGMGKSRLVAEHLGGAPDAVRVVHGGADPIDQATPFLGWRPVIRALLDLPEDADGDAVSARVAAVLPDRVELAPLVGDALAVPMADTTLTRQLTGRLRIDNSLDLLVDLLGVEASRGPLLVVLDDLHWLDRASFVLLRRAVTQVDALAVLCTTRPLEGVRADEAALLLRAPHAEQLSLDGLDHDQLQRLVCDQLGVGALPGGLLDLIVRKAQGHPYFSQVVVDALLRRGVLEVRGGQCVLATATGDLSQLDMPDTLEGVLTGRIDALPAPEQLVLKVASVIGSPFALGLLGDVHPVPDDKAEVPRRVDNLAEQQLVLPEVPEPEPEYRFQHEILREVSYGLLLFQQRQRLHRAIAEWLEQQAADRPGAWLPLLAHHWGHAAGSGPTLDPEAAAHAVRYLGRAGEQSLGAFANEQAIRFLDQALALEDQLAPGDAGAFAGTDRGLRRARLRLRLSSAYQGLGDLGQCQAHGERGLTELGKPVAGSDAMCMASTLWQTVRRRLPGLLLPADDTSELGRATAQVEAELYIALARTYYHTNASMLSLYANAHKLRQAEQLGPSPELAEAYGGVALILGLMGMDARADPLFADALAMADEVGVQTMRVTVRVIHSAYLIGAGRTDELQAEMEVARAICEELGDHDQWGDCVGLAADAAMLAGQTDQAIALYDALRDAALQHNNHLHHLWAIRGHAGLALRDDRPDDAAPLLEHALVLLERTVDQHTRIDMNGLLAVARLRQGRWADAYAHAAASAALIAEVQTPTAYGQYLGYAAVAETFLELAAQAGPLADVPDDLAPRCMQAIKDLDKYAGAFRIGKPQADRYRGIALARAGKQGKAHKAFIRGLATARELGLPHEVAQLEGLLA